MPECSPFSAAFKARSNFAALLARLRSCPDAYSQSKWSFARGSNFRIFDPQTQRRPGRNAQAVAVNCWYWTKAIALKREPRASSPLFPCPRSLCGDTRQAGLLRRQTSSRHGKIRHSAHRVQGRGKPVKMRLRPLRQDSLRRGDHRGLRRDALGLSNLT